ncbi:DUF7096 domain-containing protein [Halorussus caseinilyticus]|uniref:DUF7096 domain-containing protein n=1 Tax=Halorussus caseinilyticus TaxID=3034025 RepID=A0ABD5WGQ5_9EURY|nr:hypothetical protein [Halorussus sp. DT72]
MRPTFVLVLVAVALFGATGVVAADGGQNQPTWPGGDTTTANESNETTVSPGQRLAGAVGAQGASLEGDLWNRTLSARLGAATTAAERAAVVADEVETLETYLDSLEAVRSNLTAARADGDVSEGQYRASLSEFVVRARTVERRANQTVRAAADLPFAVRERNDINVTHVRNLSVQAHELYQFESEVGREVANETLANEGTFLNASRASAERDTDNYS